MRCDAQDILGEGGETRDQINLQSLMKDDPKKKKKPVKKTLDSSFKRPDGMHRELYNLLASDKSDSVPPLIPNWNQSASKIAGYRNPKAKLGLKRARHWKWVPFQSNARNDKLTLCHWRRTDRIEPEGEYPFAKFSKCLEIPTYSRDLYDSYLQVPGWTKDETDHLIELAGRFDLRWIIIHDRWDKEKFPVKRSVEDLKERYYNIVNAIKKAQAPDDVQPELVYFDAEHERRRKEQMEKLWNRTDEEIEEEEELLQELKRIEARRKEREKKAQDLQKLITAADRSPLITSCASIANLQKKKMPKQTLGRPPSVGTSLASSSSVEVMGPGLKFPEFRGVGPHMRSQEMKINQQVGQKKAKIIDQVVEKLKLEHNPIATEAIVKDFNEIRSDVLLLYELKGALTSCEYELEALRHQYRAVTGKDLDIPAHIRVTQDCDEGGGSPTKRCLTASMDVVSGNQPPRKKKMLEGSPALRKLRRS